MSIYIITIISIIILGIIYFFISPKKRLFVRIFSYPLLLEIILMPLRCYVSFAADTIIGFFLFIVFSYLLTTKRGETISPIIILFTTIIGFIMINFQRFFNFEHMLISLPDQLFHLLGIIVGYLLFKLKNYSKWVVFVVATFACVFMYAKGYDFWLNKLNYGTFTQQIIKEEITTEITFNYSTDSIININHLRGKIILLDFWNSKCGFCYEKFPIVEDIYNKYKNNKKVNFYSVNFFLKNIDKQGDAYRIIRERGYSFPVLICSDKALLKALNITCYPTVLVINTKGELVFRGNIEDADKKIEELLNEDN